MLWRILADAVLMLHLGFILFAILGGILFYRWRWIPWLHLPAFCWSSWVSFTGTLCPLTPLENHFRHRAGQDGYAGGFIDHYIVPLIYPEGLTDKIGITLGICILIWNAFVYSLILRRRRRAEQS